MRLQGFVCLPQPWLPAADILNPGNLPYWEWGLDASDPTKSPVFDGSDTSLGGNGDFIEHGALILTPPGSDVQLTFAPGNGGGCVTKGPFKDMVVHIGPVIVPIYGTGNFSGPPTGNPFDDNPRCLTRDINPNVSKMFNTFRNSTELITKNKNIADFQGTLVSLISHLARVTH